MLFNKTSQAVDRYPLGQELSDADRQRLLRYTIFWQYYLGRHWAWRREEGEPQVTLNYVKAFINKSISFMWGKGFDWVLPDDTREVVGPILKQFWKDNEKELWSWECAQTGGVTGDCWVKITWEDPNKLNGLEKGRVRFINLNSAHCFPIFDEHDKSVMREFRIIYEYDAPDRTKNKDYQPKRIKYMEIITNEYFEIHDGDKPPKKIMHNLGFLPVVHIKNIPVAGAFYGLSDAGDLITINKEMNEKITNISDIINYHQAPVTLIFGARASNLEKGANKVWSGLPKDGRVENLNMSTDLSGSQQYLEFIKKTMHEVGSIPEGTLGEEQAISNTSGVALQIQYQPLIEMKQIKAITYGNAISAINVMGLKLWEKKTGSNLKEKLPKVDDPYENRVFFRETLPKDRLEMLQEIAQRMSMPYPLITPPMALQMLGEDNPQKIIEEIEKWKKLMQPMGMEGEPQPNAPEGGSESESTEPSLIGLSDEQGLNPNISSVSGRGKTGGDLGIDLGSVRSSEYQGEGGITTYNPFGF